jgi:hypothetical protein
MSYKTIARRLSATQRSSISPKTIESRVKNIMRKTKTYTKSELMRFFNEQGIFADRLSFERKRISAIVVKITSVILIACGRVKSGGST